MAKEKKEKNEKLWKEAQDFFEDAESTCSSCGGALELDKIRLEEFDSGKVFVIDDVPALVCTECGEVWVPKPFMEEFEQMVATVKKRKNQKSKGGSSTKRSKKKKK